MEACCLLPGQYARTFEKGNLLKSLSRPYDSQKARIIWHFNFKKQIVCMEFWMRSFKLLLILTLFSINLNFFQLLFWPQLKVNDSVELYLNIIK